MTRKLSLFSLLYTVVFFSFVECKKDTMTDPNADIKEKQIRYLALGDSYTKAECEQTIHSYPSQLAKRLEKDHVKTSDMTVIAQTGWRTDNLMAAINNASLNADFDMVSLLIGVNNQYQGRSPEEYREEFRELLERAILLAGERKDKVFVISIPDYGATPFGSSNAVTIGQQIDLFNSINKEVTDSLGVRYFDITPISREAKTNPALTCSDNLHPSALMYERWVDLMYNKVLKMALAN